MSLIDLHCLKACSPLITPTNPPSRFPCPADGATRFCSANDFYAQGSYVGIIPGVYFALDCICLLFYKLSQEVSNTSVQGIQNEIMHDASLRFQHWLHPVHPVGCPVRQVGRFLPGYWWGNTFYHQDLNNMVKSQFYHMLTTCTRPTHLPCTIIYAIHQLAIVWPQTHSLYFSCCLCL